jgi:hypothetical protein
MKRRLLNLLTLLLLLLLCAAVAVLWVRSHYGSENVIWSVRARGDEWRHWEMTDAGVATRPGVLLVGRVAEWVGTAGDEPLAHRRSRLRYNRGGVMVGANVAPARLGFGWARGASPPSANPRRPGRRVALLCVPWWSLLLAACAPTLYRLLPSLRRLTRLAGRIVHTPPAAGLCNQCGYDLRATPDRCPECGTAARVRRSAEPHAGILH